MSVVLSQTGEPLDSWLDGAMHTNRFDTTNMPLPFPDALQEFRVNNKDREAQRKPA